MKALLSVHDKTGITQFAAGLLALGWEVYATDGTKKTLAASDAAGVSVHSISELTNFPEILGGRVKTLHPTIHGGILARRDNQQHLDELAQHNIPTIDLVVINLYPFSQTVADGASFTQALEHIDIGGPALLRAASKNFQSVVAVCDPADYPMILDLLGSGEVPEEIRKKLSQKAFQYVACNDSAIAQYLREPEENFPDQLTITFTKQQDLRYGENPHQRAALYREERLHATPGGIVAAQQLHGKELSFNNFLDADAAWRIVTDFAAPTIAIVKHGNPCGLAYHNDLAEAYRRAFAGDPMSAFGGVVASNRPIAKEVAWEIAKTFYEIIIAPEFDAEALEILEKKHDLRILRIQTWSNGDGHRVEYQYIQAGMLLQEPDTYPDDAIEAKTMTKRCPTPQEMEDLCFAWKVVKHVTSNAIVVANGGMVLGVGAGQSNRVTSVHLALRTAGERAKAAVLASDAFFPFPDGVEVAARGGISAIIQPGGSIRDQKIIDAADAAGIAMVFTGIRHFRH